MISMRDAFGNYIVELARIRDDFVILDADVAGGTGTKFFQKRKTEVLKIWKKKLKKM